MTTEADQSLVTIQIPNDGSKKQSVTIAISCMISGSKKPPVTVATNHVHCNKPPVIATLIIAAAVLQHQNGHVRVYLKQL